MAKQVAQFRYYAENDDKNYPKLQVRNTYTAAYTSGSVFINYLPAVQLGIQALPGTKFYLNKDVNPIIIGYTGIYELTLDGIAEINHIRFDGLSMKAINDTPNASLIVDIIYEKEEE